jgi:hypothetical protein
MNLVLIAIAIAASFFSLGFFLGTVWAAKGTPPRPTRWRSSMTSMTRTKERNSNGCAAEDNESANVLSHHSRRLRRSLAHAFAAADLPRSRRCRASEPGACAPIGLAVVKRYAIGAVRWGERHAKEACHSGGSTCCH